MVKRSCSGTSWVLTHRAPLPQDSIQDKRSTLSHSEAEITNNFRSQDLLLLVCWLRMSRKKESNLGSLIHLTIVNKHLIGPQI